MVVRLTLVWTVKSKSSMVFVAGKRAALTRAEPPWLSRRADLLGQDRREVGLVIPALVPGPLGQPGRTRP